MHTFLCFFCLSHVFFLMFVLLCFLCLFLLMFLSFVGGFFLSFFLFLLRFFLMFMFLCFFLFLGLLVSYVSLLIPHPGINRGVTGNQGYLPSYILCNNVCNSITCNCWLASLPRRQVALRRATSCTLPWQFSVIGAFVPTFASCHLTFGSSRNSD